MISRSSFKLQSNLSKCIQTRPKNNRNALDWEMVEPVTNRLLTAVTNSYRDPRHRDTPATITYCPDSKSFKVLTKSGLLQFQRLTINHVVVGGSVEEWRTKKTAAATVTVKCIQTCLLS